MANEDAGLKDRMAAAHEAGEREEGARTAGPRKPGLVARTIERCRAAVERIRLPAPDWRTFGWTLLALVLVMFIIGNWAPLRINFFGLYLDAPRAVVFVVLFLLGMVTAWLLEVRAKRARAAEEAAVEEEVAVAELVAAEALLDEEALAEEEALAAEELTAEEAAAELADQDSEAPDAQEQWPDATAFVDDIEFEEPEDAGPPAEEETADLADDPELFADEEDDEQVTF